MAKSTDNVVERDNVATAVQEATATPAGPGSLYEQCLAEIFAEEHIAAEKAEAKLAAARKIRQRLLPVLIESIDLVDMSTRDAQWQEYRMDRAAVVDEFRDYVSETLVDGRRTKDSVTFSIVKACFAAMAIEHERMNGKISRSIVPDRRQRKAAVRAFSRKFGITWQGRPVEKEVSIDQELQDLVRQADELVAMAKQRGLQVA